MGDDVIPGRDVTPEGRLKDLIPNFGQDFRDWGKQQLQNGRQEFRDWGRQQLQNGRQELRSVVTGAENDLFGVLGLQRDGKTISGNIGGVDITRSGSDWTFKVDDLTVARSRSAVTVGLEDRFLFAESPSGWSIKVGDSVDLSRSGGDTKFKLTDPFSEALLRGERSRTGFDIEGRMIDGMSFHVQKGQTGDLVHVESDGLIFEITKNGKKVTTGLTSSTENTGTIFSADPVTKTLSIYDVESGTTLTFQKTGARMFKVEESQMPRFNFKPSALLDAARPDPVLPSLRVDTDLFDGSGRLKLAIDPANINVNATNEFGPVKLTLDANQNYWLPSLLTKQGRAHPVDAVFGRYNVDVNANFGDRIGVGFNSDGQNPTIRVMRGLESGDWKFGAQYNWRTHRGDFMLEKSWNNWIFRLNGGPGNVGVELRFEK